MGEEEARRETRRFQCASKRLGVNNDDDANVNKKHRAPVVLCRRRVHGCVLAVAKLPIKVRDTSMELRK